MDKALVIKRIDELMEEKHISYYVTQNKKIKSLEKIRFHDLRHSCAALLRHEGVPMEDIQKWLGHSQITTTESIYAHFEDKTHLKSAQKILNAFSD